MTSKQSSSPPNAHNDSVPSGIGATLGDNSSSCVDDSSRVIRVSLQLEANDLPNLGSRGKSNPLVILYRRSDNSSITDNKWDKIGQTETVYNNLNPKWSNTFTVEYRFGASTALRFNIFHRDSKEEDVSRDEYIGEVCCTVAQVVLADDQRVVSQINNKKAKPGARTGTLTIRAEEQQGDLGDNVTFQFAVTGMRRVRKPFYILSNKNRNDLGFSPVVYSEVHKAYAGTNNVTTFKPITTSLTRLANGDMDRELEVQFMDYNRLGSHSRGGSVRFTLRAAKDAITSGSPARYTLRKKRSNGQVVEMGELILNKCEVTVPFSFVDYIRSGVEINTVIAIDMSNTNGHPADPRSLQYKDGENEYIIALREVGNVLAAYDTTKNFPAFGFGATQPPLFRETAHCFPLNGLNGLSMGSGINGVIEGYRKALHTVGPFEPCRYGPVLNHVINMTRVANAKQEAISYTILLHFTDGDFVDLADVANLICDGAELPLSIVIVGVGNSRFLELERLDGDNERLCSTEGIPCARDIVQFVKFHNHRYNPTQLAREVLDEIPEQLVSYMRSKGLKPSDIKPIHKLRVPTKGGPYLPESGLQPTLSSTSKLGSNATHPPEIPPPPYSGQPGISAQRPPHFAPVGALSMVGATGPSSDFLQSPMPPHVTPGMPLQMGEHGLTSMPFPGPEPISPSTLNQSSVPTQGTPQAVMPSQSSIHHQGLPYQNAHVPQSEMYGAAKYSVMVGVPGQFHGGYIDHAQAPNQGLSLPQQLHQPLVQPHHQQAHQQHHQENHQHYQIPQYGRPPPSLQPNHSQHPQHPQQYTPQPYGNPYSNMQYGSVHQHPPYCDLAASHPTYHAPPRPNFEYPVGSAAFPPELPFHNQQNGPNYPSR